MSLQKIYQLWTCGEEYSLLLATAASSDKKTAMRELKVWAKTHRHQLMMRPGDLDANCMIVELLPITET